MHRTHRFQFLRLLFVAALGVALLSLSATGQDVPRPEKLSGSLFIGIEVTRSVQLSTKKKIKSGTIENARVAKFEPDPKDATMARVTGLMSGLTHLELVDENENHEWYEVIVEPDLEYVRRLVERRVPGSNVSIDSAGGGVLVSGFVDSPENVTTIMDTIQLALGGKVVNNMRIVGVQQVQLCVVIAEVSRTKLRNMSFAWDNAGANHFIGSAMGLSNSLTQSSSIVPGAATGAATASLLGSPGNLFLGLVNNQQAFWGFLQALKNESLLKTLAEPTLNCESGRQGNFLAGGQQAIPVPSGLGAVGVQFEDFGVKLSYVPTVLGNGRIRLELEPEVSDLNAGFGTTINGTTVPGRTTQKVHTTVEMESGQTYVIGGLIRNTINASTSKVPVVGEIPYLGTLFSAKSYSDTEDELLIIVTPQFVAPMDCAQVPRVLPGQETRTPDDFELFLEGILEAPRGPRPIFDGCHYNAAWKMSPTASMFPCTDCKGNCKGGCGNGHCSTGNCAGGDGGSGYVTGGGLAHTGKPTPQSPVDPKVKKDLPPASQAPTVTPGFSSLMPPGDTNVTPRTDPPAPVFLPAVTPGSK